MAENGARLQWAGAGLSLPDRLLTPRTLRWAVQRVLEQPGFRSRAQAIASWAAENDGPAAAAALVESFAGRVRVQAPKLTLGLRFQRGRGPEPQ